ncbi:hypothetical protein [Peloplasma aerotolerans]|uniref:Uncharacterized protein n=1 Tax=Peloplasma aerotolerans TaxID=3044389 RepID=A0AAW6U3M9_9MOLU|nr:hypothetical protein [Mariniplasma sp. M4Ah]MDI6452573.1 hypothetical protein [Mariniplasma sp. M4Ah]
MKNQNKILFMFIIGQVIVYTFIIMLQLMPKSLFWILLVLMHLGIIIMIISKKKFIAQGYQVKIYYHRVYLLLILFLPVMFYKLLSGLLTYSVNDTIVTYYTIVIASITILLSFLNILKFSAFLSIHK